VMHSTRRIEINGYVVEEFYWNGRMVVYVDNRRVDRTYEAEVVQIEADDDKRFAEECERDKVASLQNTDLW